MILDISKLVVTKETRNEKIGFLPITKEQYDSIDEATELFYKGSLTVAQFKEKYNYHPLSFILYGDTKEVNNELIYRYIDVCTLSEGNKQLNSYKCFCGQKYKLDYKSTILHRSAIDSFRCLLAFTGNPKYGVILDLNYL